MTNSLEMVGKTVATSAWFDTAPLHSKVICVDMKIVIIIASLARDIALYDHDHAAQHCPTAVGCMYPNVSTV